MNKRVGLSILGVLGFALWFVVIAAIHFGLAYLMTSANSGVYVVVFGLLLGVSGGVIGVLAARWVVQ